MDGFSGRKPRRAATRREARANQRWRLLEAMGHLVGRNGYAQTSIAQVIARAGVSRKAFYEYFPDKEACFLAAYEELSLRLIQTLVERGAEEPVRSRTRAQLGRYLEVLASDPAAARAFIVEVLGAGPKALAVREEVNRRFAEVVIGHAAQDPLVRKGIIGGINDIVGAALMDKRKDLTALLPGLVRFVER